MCGSLGEGEATCEDGGEHERFVVICEFPNEGYM